MVHPYKIQHILDQDELKKKQFDKKILKVTSKHADNLNPKRVQIESEPEKYHSSHRIFTPTAFGELILVRKKMVNS